MSGVEGKGREGKGGREEGRKGWVTGVFLRRGAEYCTALQGTEEGRDGGWRGKEVWREPKTKKKKKLRKTRNLEVEREAKDVRGKRIQLHRREQKVRGGNNNKDGIRRTGEGTEGPRGSVREQILVNPYV